jgi:hypothetical protein
MRGTLFFNGSLKRKKGVTMSEKTIVDEPSAVNEECENKLEKAVNHAESNNNLATLLAEVIVENIIKKIRNGCDRVHKNK